MDKLKASVIRAAKQTAAAMRDAADRLDKAADSANFEALADCCVSLNVRPVDQIRGLAQAIVRIEAE